MSVAARDPNASAAATSPADSTRAIGDFDPPMAHLLVNLGAIESVERIAFRTSARQLDVWVMLAARSLVDEERIYRLDHAYRQAGGRADIDLHVISLDRTEAGLLPTPDFVVERAKS